jgi:hypothetical protein
MGLMPPNIIRPPSDNPLLNRPLNHNLCIKREIDTPLSVLWENFEINLGRFLLNLWRNFCNGLRIPEPAHPSGGQSNTALIALMQGIEREIENRSAYCAIPDYGYTTQEVANALYMMVSAKPGMQDYQSEQCSFTQINDDGFALVLPVEETRQNE